MFCVFFNSGRRVRGARSGSGEGDREIRDRHRDKYTGGSGRAGSLGRRQGSVGFGIRQHL